MNILKCWEGDIQEWAIVGCQERLIPNCCIPVQKRQYDKKEKLNCKFFASMQCQIYKKIATTTQTNQNCMLNRKVSCATSLLESEDIDWRSKYYSLLLPASKFKTEETKFYNIAHLQGFSTLRTISLRSYSKQMVQVTSLTRKVYPISKEKVQVAL